MMSSCFLITRIEEISLEVKINYELPFRLPLGSVEFPHASFIYARNSAINMGFGS